MRLVKLALLSTALIGLIAIPAAANHAWADYHWARPGTPFSLTINVSVTSDWQARTSAVNADWNNAAGPLRNTLVSASTDMSTRKRCPAVSGQLRVCNASYGNNGWLGIAQIWIDSNHHIVQGVEKLNDYYFNGFASYNNEAERRHVECQEIGHTFGLGHQDESGASLNTCMDYYHNLSDSDTQSTTPNAHDYEELNTIYAHSDPYPTIKTRSASKHGNATVTRDGDYDLITFIIAAD